MSPSSPKLRTMAGSSSTTKKSTSFEELDTSRAQQLKDLNQQIWRPWWDSYLQKCQDFIRAARDGNYDTVARLINQDYAADMAVNVNY